MFSLAADYKVMKTNRESNRRNKAETGNSFWLFACIVISMFTPKQTYLFIITYNLKMDMRNILRQDPEAH